MPVNMHGQVVVQLTAPGEAPVKVGTLWSDTTTGLIKVCTSVSPYTFVTVHGGAVLWSEISDFTGSSLSQLATKSATDLTSGTLAVARGGTGVDNTTQSYSPTPTSVANLDSTPLVGVASYTRVGNVVTVQGRITMDPTTISTLTQARLSLPIPSNFSDTDQASGIFGNRGVAITGSIMSVAATDDVIFEFTCVDTASRNYVYIYQYRVL